MEGYSYKTDGERGRWEERDRQVIKEKYIKGKVSWLEASQIYHKSLFFFKFSMCGTETQFLSE